MDQLQFPEPAPIPTTLSESFRTEVMHYIKVFRSNIAPSIGMIQKLPCGRVDCRDGCWEAKQSARGEALAWALGEASMMLEAPVQVLEGDMRAWDRVLYQLRYDGEESTLGVRFPHKLSVPPKGGTGAPGFTLFAVSQWDLGNHHGLKPLLTRSFSELKPITRVGMALIPGKSWSERFWDPRTIQGLIGSSSELRELTRMTTALCLAQGRTVRALGRSAYVTGINKFTANPERKFCEGEGEGPEGVHQPAWVWNGQVKVRGKPERMCRWCGGRTTTPWRALKSGSKVRDMGDALKALEKFGVKGEADSSFCYFQILPGQSDIEIEVALALYGTKLAPSFYLTHSEPSILDALDSNA